MCSEQINKKVKFDVRNNPSKIIDDRIVRLIAKKEIAKNTVELTFEKPINLKYKAGQYAVLEILKPKHNELDMPISPLSFVSHPQNNYIKFTMRYSESSYKKSIKAMNIGDQCRVFGPMGNFELKDKNINSISFLISGVGITPIISFLEELKTKTNNQIKLFYTNKTEEKTAYNSYLNSLEKSMSNFNYYPIYTKGQDRINSDFLLQKHNNNLTDIDFYIVGSKSFAGSMKDILVGNSVNKRNIIIDDFG